VYKNNFIKVGVALPKIKLAKPLLNAKEIVDILNVSKSNIVVFPELCISSYSASDFFYQISFLEDCINALFYIVNNTTYKNTFVVGLPISVDGILYNCSCLVNNKRIKGFIPKKYLPNHVEFYEKRWFNSFSGIRTIYLKGSSYYFGDLLFKDLINGITIGVEICQDLWALNSQSDYLVAGGANIILNLSASSEEVGKSVKRRNIVLEHSRRQMSLYLYANPGSYESSTELIYSSQRIIALMGNLINESFDESKIEIRSDIYFPSINYARSKESAYLDSINSIKKKFKIIPINTISSDTYEFERIETLPFVTNTDLDELFDYLVKSLNTKINSLPLNLKNIILGLSGGLDSTLAFLIARKSLESLSLDENRLKLFFMPTVNTSLLSKEIIEGLNTNIETINLDEHVEEQLKLIDHEKDFDVTYENVQARLRTLLLMSYANKLSGFVLGTSNLSEIALGFMTYNGDHMSMYAINSGVPKTVIKALIKNVIDKKLFENINDSLIKVHERTITPELTLEQDSEKVIGSYVVNDFILYNYFVFGMREDDLVFYVLNAFNLEYHEAKLYVSRFFKRFYTSQYKRSTLPEGPKVFSFSLSPRTTYRLPSDIEK
jgi:NAD+ synthase (glutamine-hydrolysing)